MRRFFLRIAAGEKRFLVRAGELLAAFLEFEAAIRASAFALTS